MVYVGNMEVVEAHPQRNGLSKIANKEGQTEMTKDSDRIKKILLQESTSNCRWRVYTLHDKTYPPFEKEEIKKRAKEQLDPKPAPLPVIGSQLPTANISATSAETVKVFASKLRRKKVKLYDAGGDILSKVVKQLAKLVFCELLNSFITFMFSSHGH